MRCAGVIHRMTSPVLSGWSFEAGGLRAEPPRSVITQTQPMEYQLKTGHFEEAPVRLVGFSAWRPKDLRHGETVQDSTSRRL